MSKVAQSPIRSSTLRVLVVEDNAMCQTLAKAVLERGGHIVTIAENEETAGRFVIADGRQVAVSA